MLHVGGGRTALYNWLLARGCGGKFVLRIEDTDRERSTEASVQVILDGMKWLGLDWDEGPFYQSQRTDRYVAVVKDLLAKGSAYPCFCAEADLDARREAAKAEGRPFTYDGRCRAIDPDEARRRAEAGESHVIRFRVPPGRVEFEDMIGGPRAFENALLGDFVILRADGSPIYQLTVVVDDDEMGITHVLRGDDHLSNTPRQILIFEAMGRPVPRYGHIPLIKGPDGSRLSKRHGATSVMEFAREGILPDAMVNYLALLGWSLDEKTEVISREELIRHFSIDRVNSSAATFDVAKLRWMNSVYLRAMPRERVVELAREHFLANGIAEGALADPRFSFLIGLEIERSKTFSEMRENLAFFFRESLEGYEEKAAQKHFAGEPAALLLETLATELESAPDAEFDLAAFASLETRFRSLAERQGLSFGKLVHPLRLALTGRSASPGIFEVIVGLGRDRSVGRLRAAAAWIRSRAAA